MCRHHCQKFRGHLRVELTLRFKCWTDNRRRNGVDDWNTAFVTRLKREARCRVLLEKVVKGRTGTIMNIEELLTMPSEAKEM